MMIIKQIDNLLRIPSLFFFIFKSYKHQQRFMKKSILPDLEDFKQKNNHILTEKDDYKIRFYYGLAVPAIGEFYSLLRGKEFKQSERKSLTYLGGITGLFDDFFDEAKTPESHLKEMINNPSLKLARNFNEKLFILFYLKALEQGNSTSIKEYFNAGFEAQVQSKKQMDPNLSCEEITQITKQKGGIFMILYRSALEGDITEQEKNLLFQIGFLGQLENDIFDIYKDHLAGVRTLATTTKSIKALRSNYETILKDAFDGIKQTDFPKGNKKKFSRLFAVIASRGLVCLNQLEKLDHSESFEISSYSREELICNMGTF
jgi:hypothetical protein